MSNLEDLNYDNVSKQLGEGDIDKLESEFYKRFCDKDWNNELNTNSSYDILNWVRQKLDEKDKLDAKFKKAWDKMHDELAAKDAEIAKLKKKLNETLNSDITKCMNFDALKDELDIKDAKIAELRKQFSLQEIDYQNVKAESDSKDAEIAKLKAKWDGGLYHKDLVAKDALISELKQRVESDQVTIKHMEGLIEDLKKALRPFANKYDIHKKSEHKWEDYEEVRIPYGWLREAKAVLEKAEKGEN